MMSAYLSEIVLLYFHNKTESSKIRYNNKRKSDRKALLDKNQLDVKRYLPGGRRRSTYVRLDERVNTRRAVHAPTEPIRIT